MEQSFVRTLKRFFSQIKIFNPIKNFPLVLEGLALTFSRVSEYEKNVRRSVIPNTDMDVASIDDHNKKYNIPAILQGTNSQKIARLTEKANLNGFVGKDFLESQLHKAGFSLYVIEQEILDSSKQQFGDIQFSPTVQFGLSSRFENPANIPGYLVVSDPPYGAGRLYLAQFGNIQFGDQQMGTLDPNALNPLPFIYKRTLDPRYWGFYFVLSPQPDKYVTSESEFLTIDNRTEYEYLKQIILELKLQRNWCILQAKIS